MRHVSIVHIQLHVPTYLHLNSTHLAASSLITIAQQAMDNSSSARLGQYQRQRLGKCKKDSKKPPSSRRRRVMDASEPPLSHNAFLMGHPHSEAEPQATEPFWWQQPCSQAPGTWSHYDTRSGRFYRSKMRDRPARSNSKTAATTKPPSPPRARAICQNVGVYIGTEECDFVEVIPLRVLKRFSRSALKAFPKIESATNTCTSLHLHPILHEKDVYMHPLGAVDPDTLVDRASHTSEQDDHTSASFRSRSSSTQITAPTEVTTLINSTSGSVLGNANDLKMRTLHSSDATGRGDKVFMLDLDVVEMPSNRAVHTALKWMKDNQSAPLDGQLLDYGPPDLTRLPTFDLVDLYQAALAFDMRPFPARLRKEILDRVTDMTPDTETFKQLTYYLPLDDSVVTRFINTVESRRHQGCYTQREMDKFNEFLFDHGNEFLEARVREINAFRRKRWLERNQSKHDWVEYVDSSTTTRFASVVEDDPGLKLSVPEVQDSAESSDKASSAAARPRRRRNRRKAQRAYVNRQVPGANY